MIFVKSLFSLINYEVFFNHTPNPSLEELLSILFIVFDHF